MFITKVKAAFFLSGVTFLSASFAAVDVETAKIETLLIDGNNYGKCMIYGSSFNPSNNCPANWFTIDCAGEFRPKEDARRMWDSVQLAYALDSTVEIVINDSYKHNGYCLVERMKIER